MGVRSNANSLNFNKAIIVNNPKDFYSGEVFVQKGSWLEHIFILPEYHGLGIGRQLTDQAKDQAFQMGVKELFIFSDPNARGFYDKIGATFSHMSQSSIPGRELPVFSLKTN